MNAVLLKINILFLANEDLKKCLTVIQPGAPKLKHSIYIQKL